jgi:WD40 repeat protein
MAIKYYPGRTYKRADKLPLADRQRVKRLPQKTSGRQDISNTINPLDVVISANDDWQLDSILFHFSAATSRDFAIKIMNGRKVVTNLNDFLWFQIGNGDPQKITLDSGFYTGTQLATELQTQLDANTVFVAAGVTFTVAYSSTTGFFTITPSSGTIKYWDVNTRKVLTDRDSIAGHLFGLTSTTTSAASVTSDTAVFGLNEETILIDSTVTTALKTVLDYVLNDIHTLSVDQAIHLTSTSGIVLVIDYSVIYEELI